MDSSYTNPYGAQPSTPNGGQENNAWPPVSDPIQFGGSYSNAHGDIVLTSSQPGGKLGLKRILILAGIGLAVVTLFILAIVAITSSNRAASEAQAADRKEKLTVLENFYEDYSDLLEYYSEIGYEPVEDMAYELEDTNKLFIVKKATLIMLEIMSDALEDDFEKVADTDFNILGATINDDANQVVANIKPGLENIKTNITTLRAFYDAFITPVQESLNEDTATKPCTFEVTASDMDGLTVDGFDVDEAISNYNQAYCALNDELYYGTFSGKFDSSYIRNAKESLIKVLLNTVSQAVNLDDLEQILFSVDSDKVKVDYEDDYDNDYEGLDYEE
ncbi:MAG: hypothetical protein K6G36_01890 [Candidatus Saccharibacteria bacterium]|nr:hypothetical protein [Candidatus Saccharibacteria bacterium]